MSLQPISSTCSNEAQTQTIPGTQTSLSFPTTASPEPTPTHLTSARLSIDTTVTCIGATPLASPTKASIATHGSRHDVRLPKTSFPPPYTSAQFYDKELPAYDETPDIDPTSLAENVFKIGFCTSSSVKSEFDLDLPSSHSISALLDSGHNNSPHPTFRSLRFQRARISR
ncbi:hypothetical protein PILCRDRAFT_828547 [Piloderma croceum F 1598]|uniref:Uncharacterized protein n=1 Tax=Piloderma croceum (strain F 1598) TaxID=765440 RepID=A0A0C3F2K6_PILCF|nr:hypothetical protein PILCRDRAFT_828547 [Piloderma croceum F 1598]